MSRFQQLWWATLALPIFLLVLLLAGCGPAATAHGTGTRLPLPTALHVIRTAPAYPENHFPPLERQVTDSAAVQRLYTAMYALPPIPKYPPGGVYCPADFGIVYHLAFQAGSAVVEQADAYVSGCEAIALSATDRRMPNDAFWSLFAQTLGITRAELFPAPTR